MMKIIRICFAGLMLMTASCATVKHFPVAKYFALVKDGKTASCIVLPDNVSPVEKHAASELSSFLEKVTGAKVAVQNTPAKDLYNIYLGTTGAKNMPRSAAIDKAVAQLKDDGFVLAADKDGLRVISKKPVGVLFGAYEILKKYADMRWFAPGAEYEFFSKKQTVSIPGQVVVSNPSFKVRTISIMCTWNAKIVDTWDWLVRNGMFIRQCSYEYKNYRDELEKRGAKIYDGGHSFSGLLSDKLFDEHPEYFPLIDGKRIKQESQTRQPCTSNPKVAEIMAESLNKLLDSPTNKIDEYLIGGNDNTRWCQCEKCTAIDPPDEKQKGYRGTRYFSFVNKIAGEVYKSHPDAHLWAYAYWDYEVAPTGVVPDRRLSIEACIYHRCYRHSMADMTCLANAKYRDILAGWLKLGNPVIVREYTDCFTRIEPPYLPVENIYCQDLKYYHRIGLAGFQIPICPPDGNYSGGYSQFNTSGVTKHWYAIWPMMYLAAQMAWDVNADYARLVEDMGSKYYGKAWPVMKRYREDLVRMYEETPGDIWSHVPAYILGKCLEKPEVEAGLLQLLDQAEQSAAGNEPATRRIKRDREYFGACWQTLHKGWLAKRQQELNVNKRVDKIVIDGKFEENDWKKTDFTSNFIATDGKTAAAPQTFVKMLYDEENIYFAVEAMEPEPGKMKINVKERDGNIFADSSLEFFFAAPAGMDGKYAQIAVNPRGVIYDAMSTASLQYDQKFDSGIEVKTGILADRWVAEIRMPVVLWGLKIKDGEVWKINVARNRILVDGTSQGSSWCNGVFHGTEAYRSVAFGGAGLVQNGDFEDVEKPSEWPAYKVKTKWKFAADSAPCKWGFYDDYAGEAAVMEGGAASGRKYLRLKSSVTNGLLIISQPRMNLNAADTLRVRAKVRGQGVISAVAFRHDKTTGKFSQEPAFGEKKVATNEWTNVEAIYNYDGQKYLTLALYVRSNDGLDIDDVTITRGKK